jgi:hypothetical protein
MQKIKTEASINYNEAVQNSVKNVLNTENSNSDIRNLRTAVDKAIDFFNRTGNEDSIKNIIIISGEILVMDYR